MVARMPEPPAAEPAPPASLAERLRWLWLAFVPSSALLATTEYLTSDIGAIPLLWVVPLAIYLASFILVFSPRMREMRLSKLGKEE